MTWKASVNGPSWLPVERILWAPTNSAHNNHLHVVGDPRFEGTPPSSNPGVSPSLKIIIDALDKEFGKGVSRNSPDAESAGWTHMGIYNRRYISGTTIWSQHSWSNAIDIGPYYGVAEQQKFFDFLTKEEDDLAILTDKEQYELKKFLAYLDEMGSNVGFVKYTVPDIRKDLITKDELNAAIQAIDTNTAIDQHARALAQSALNKLAAIKAAI